MISADAIICVDETQKIIFFNDGAEAIFGYSCEEIMGKPLDMLIPQRFRPTHGAHVTRFGKAGTRARKMGERGQISGLRKSGEEFPADAAISHLDGVAGKVYAVVLRDVTERRRAHENQRFLAEAGETLASSLGSDDTLRNVTRIAVPRLAEACIVNVYHSGQVQGIAVAHVDPDRATRIEGSRLEHPINPESAHPVAQVLRTGQTVLLSAVDPDATHLQEPLTDLVDIFGTRPQGGIALPLRARGQLVGVLGLYRQSSGYSDNDIFLAEELARRAAMAIDNARLHDLVHVGIRARDDMIGIVSHDLRNPVNAVKMLTGVMLDRERHESLPSEIGDYAAIIRQAAEQMDSLIRDLLDVSRVEAGRLQVATKSENTEEMLSDALRTLAPLAHEKSMRLRLTAPDEIPAVMADRERFSQALSNIVGNAVKFSPAGSEIRVRVTLQDNDVVFSVTDTGRGMTPQQLTHAFDRFWQSSRTDRQGAGLGLAIAKGIIEAHGGRIWAESIPGEGSTFCFTLPQAATALP